MSGMTMMDLSEVKVLAFDADDTLWDCQSHFEKATDRCCEILAPFADAVTVRAALFQTETKNMPDLGFGTKAFTLSLVENAIRVSKGQVPANDVARILELGRELLHLPATPLDGVVETLDYLQKKGRWKMVLFTKGELLDQQSKLHRSGLAHFFSRTVIVSDKTPDEYRRLCSDCRCLPQELLMVGNSFKSDIQPVLEIGGYAVHIPFHVTWELEHAPTFRHERLAELEHFTQLVNLLN